MTDNVKICSKCFQELSRTEFGKNSRAPDGLYSVCRLCRKKLRKEYYDANTEKCKKLSRDRYYKMKAALDIVTNSANSG